jgi:LysR family transcriptional regulator, transcriptional activator for dmlA
MTAFSDVEFFALIVKLGSMAAAAQELGVTPPVVTRRLASLEKRLAVRLMNRTTRKLSLTPEGEIYLMEGVRILEAMRALENRVGEGGKQPHGTLRVAATLGFGRAHIAPALSKFTRQYPLVDVQLHLSDRPVHLVDQGFNLLVRFGEPADSRLTARLLARNKRILCAAPAYLARAGVPAHPRDLGRHNCIFIRQGDETFGTWHLHSSAGNESIKVRSNLSTNDGSSALAWALEGQGILLRSQWEIGRHLRARRLVPLLQAWASPAADVYLVFQGAAHTSAKVRALVDGLLDAFRTHRTQTKGPAGAW